MHSHPIDHQHAHPAADARPTLTTRLRESTKDLHTRVERHPSQAALLRGGATIDSYAAYLSQLCHAQAALDEACAAAGSSEPRVGRVLRPYHARAAHALDDLTAIQRDRRGASPATTRFAAWIRSMGRDEPIALLGALYVLEGSTNGGVYIASAMRKTMPLPPNAATRFLDPHGPEQRQRWAEFKADADGLDLTPKECDRIVQVACDTFLGLESIFEDLAAEAAPGPASPGRG
jgi:heme oxygenase